MTHYCSALGFTQLKQTNGCITNTHTNKCSLDMYLLALAPFGPLFKGRDVPERQTTGEVDDSQQGAIRAQTHAKHTILDNTYAKNHI